MEVTEASVLLLPFAASSVGVARRRLVSDLIAADIYDSAVCDVALVISELFSNALRHAVPLPGSKIRVAWRIDADSVQVSVSDGGGQTVPELGEPTQAATGGRGLRIVERLSRRWGTSTGDEGTTVWAEVPVRPVETEDDDGRRAGRGDGQRLDQLADTERRAAVRTIAERAGSLGRLVEQLLLGSRVGADQLPVSNGPFDLAAVLHGAAAAFRPLSDKHVVVADIPADLPAASGDTMATDIIVGQLLENAFKYSPQGGTVSIRARVTGEGPGGTGGGSPPGAEGVGAGWIEVTVEDEGIGIADGDHERIFDRFFQGEAGDRRRFGGVGIGLFIVRRLAEAQHGEVTAGSRPCGGTIMSLRLRPAAD